MRSRYWLGIDAGTQSIKAVVVSRDGAIRAEGSAAVAGRRDGVRHEQDPRAWVDGASEACRQAVERLTGAERSTIGGIAVCSTSGSLAIVDRRGEPVSAALMYDDRRGASFASELIAEGEGHWARIGAVPGGDWAVCRLAWLRDHGELREGRYPAHQGDVIASALTGHRVATDWTSALKTGYDPVTARWPTELFGGSGPLGGMDVGALPRVVAPGVPIGAVCRRWSETTGVPVGTPVLSGMTDGCAAQLASGTYEVGDWHTVVGTTLVFKGVSRRPVSDGEGLVYSHRGPAEGIWLPGSASNAGAGAVADVFPDVALDAVDRRLSEERVPLRACYPSTRVGERFPFRSATATGFVCGAGGHGLDALRRLPESVGVASIWAGVACAEKLGFEVLSGLGLDMTGRLSSSGGGTKSLSWTTMRSSLLGKQILLPSSSEGGVGMAVLARWGAGTLDGDEPIRLQDLTSQMTTIRATVDPDPDLAAQMADVYGEFHDELERRGWI